MEHEERIRRYLSQCHNLDLAKRLAAYMPDGPVLPFVQIHSPIEKLERFGGGVGVDITKIRPYGCFVCCDYRFKQGVQKGKLRHSGVYFIKPEFGLRKDQLWKSNWLAWLKFSELNYVGDQE